MSFDEPIQAQSSCVDDECCREFKTEFVRLGLLIRHAASVSRRSLNEERVVFVFKNFALAARTSMYSTRSVLYG